MKLTAFAVRFVAANFMIDAPGRGLHLGDVTRPHVDVDWYCWRDDAATLAERLGTLGWRPDPRMPATLQLDLLRDDVELSFAYLGRDADGRVVVGAGPWAGTLLPDGMLAGPPGRIGALTAPVISVAAQIELKEMFPVWMPDRPRRAKDAAELTPVSGRQLVVTRSADRA
ncbi:hypothetical protein [Micromonospora sp. CNB394]|uniref:hypothetical protein n=1 Tax=Micromonospora sp. CNB394 TaxID=1169151 RepID=UPI00036810E0|nr:hypothetical protein [Micromonospora sp. CNB394]